MADAVSVRDLEVIPIEIDDETAIRAYKAKMQKDLETFRKREQAKYLNDDKQLEEIFQIEVCKTSDFLMNEFGINLTNLLRYVQKNKIEQKDEIKSFRKLYDAQKASETKARAAKATPSAEIVADMLEEAK